MPLPLLLQSRVNYEASLRDGLAGMLQQPSAGDLILILANLLTSSKPPQPLLSKVQAAIAGYDTASPQARKQIPPDDLNVLTALQQTSGNHYESVSWRSVPPWKIQFNPLRALRPPRNATAGRQPLRQAFDPKLFHFNLPFLDSETCFKGSLSAVSCKLLYNKFPFATGHTLLVPEAARQHPQWLSQDWHQWAWSLLQQISGMPVALAYNSLGAGASINHLHFHCVLEDSYPIESGHWAHNGGTQHYPAEVLHFTDIQSAWDCIRQQQAGNQPFNLFYRKQQMYLIRRKYLSDCPAPAGFSSLSWYESCGHFVCFDPDNFQQINAMLLTNYLSDSRI
ncbi:MAG: hypothetical protein KZQ58_00890 [gamma proteobacterium symbiont of Bathyaustriella thionipta]|nr:hypothetical protein [gamma proteobacterium symbiont of Bathyaustriella thionipta]